VLCLLPDKIEPPKKNSDCPEWESRKSQKQNSVATKYQEITKPKKQYFACWKNLILIR